MTRSSAPLFAPPPADSRRRALLRVALSYYLASGVSAAFGLLLISAGTYLALGSLAAAGAAVGVMVCIPPDQAAPRRGKLRSLLPAVLLGLPLFLAVQAVRDDPLLLGAVLVPATFFAFLGGAWGPRGAPLVISIMFAMVFSMAMPATAGNAIDSAAYFALGSGLYLLYATAANALLNGRYRVQLLADTLFDLASLMRDEAEGFELTPEGADGGREPLIGRRIADQAVLADHLQLARNLLLESPRTARRRQLAAMFLHVLEMRDHLLTIGLDLNAVRADPAQAPVLGELRAALLLLAAQTEAVGDALLGGSIPPPLLSLRPQLAALDCGEAANGVGPPSARTALATALARGLANRISNLSDELVALIALGRGDAEPDLAAVRLAWQLFVSPSAWSLWPLRSLWQLEAPPLRHALRAALAVGCGYALTFALPWASYGHWILLTIVVVLRGSLAQTLERRNSRVAGTFVGCLIAGGVLAAGLPLLVLLLVISIAQALAHGFVTRRYLVTSVAATVLSLVQVHLVHAGADPMFEVLERMADTLIGVGIAWAFSYVLPSWERTQVPALVTRTLAAHCRHARQALGLGQLAAVDNEPEIAWRLARREAHDSLSALVQATQRALAEPRAVRPPLQPLGQLVAHGYQMLAQLSAIKAMLLSDRGRLDPNRICNPLEAATARIEALIGVPPSLADESAPPAERRPGSGAITDGAPLVDELAALRQAEKNLADVALGDPFGNDLSPWLLRRLELVSDIAAQMREEAAEVLTELAHRERRPAC